MDNNTVWIFQSFIIRLKEMLNDRNSVDLLLNFRRRPSERQYTTIYNRHKGNWIYYWCGIHCTCFQTHIWYYTKHVIKNWKSYTICRVYRSMDISSYYLILIRNTNRWYTYAFYVVRTIHTHTNPRYAFVRYIDINI